MAQAGEDAEILGRTSPSGNQKYEDDKDMDRLFKKFKKELDPDHSGAATIPEPFIFTLRDTQQKVICLQGNNLVAAPAVSNISPAEIKVMPNQVVPGDQAHNPIFLGVGNRCLSCGTSGQPALQLENRTIESVYNDKSKNLPYTFSNLKIGSTHQFKSMAFPEWFLCTSQGNNEALSITNSPGEKQITDFYFKNIKG